MRCWMREVVRYASDHAKCESAAPVFAYRLRRGTVATAFLLRQDAGSAVALRAMADKYGLRAGEAAVPPVTVLMCFYIGRDAGLGVLAKRFFVTVVV